MQQQPPQPTISPCPQCGGQRVGMGCASGMHLMRDGKFASTPVCELTAVVCMVCGYTALYAEDLPKIHQEVRMHPGDFTY
jgi:predicted nucleic-acid-binding Zn-ribbon protein